MRRFLKDENGATALEYALILALIGVAMVAGSQNVADAVVDLFFNIACRFGDTGAC